MGCIYVIENTVNGKKYIGQTVNTANTRKTEHFRSLKRCKHYNSHLQQSWNKYGESAFTFKILVDNLPEHYMDDMERGFIATFRTMDKKYGYNKESGGNLNKKKSEDTKLKMSLASKGKKKSPEHIEKLRQSKLGKPSLNKGRKMSPEQVEANRQAALAYYAKGGVSPLKGRKQELWAIEKRRQSRLEYFKNGGMPPISTNSRKIIDSEGVTWPSVLSFCLVYGVPRTTASRYLKSGKPCKGIYIKYLETTKEAQVG